MAAGDEILVNTKKIEDKAADLRKDLAALLQCAGKLQKTVNSTASWWTGEAGDAFRNEAGRSVRLSESLIKELQKYPDRLLNAAGIMDSAEKENEDRAGDLPAGIFD